MVDMSRIRCVFRNQAIIKILQDSSGHKKRRRRAVLGKTGFDQQALFSPTLNKPKMAANTVVRIKEHHRSHFGLT